eukprot:TRINITY_DN1755_c0_g1_i5.p1 TRINITY_DN1755_c0_g1~~TRINITY_DN1755_c0_g1_i5.p1  ORF type:complete len:107 (+),score=48.92 TRINITY_DN1755_c0_g1_i5:372-692(+)
MTSTKIDKTPDVKSVEFDLDAFINQKLGKVNSKNEKKIISDSSSSSLADLVKFNTTLAYSFYKITDDNSLETIADSMNQRNKWEKEDKSSILRKMNQDLNKIINDF